MCRPADALILITCSTYIHVHDSSIHAMNGINLFFRTAILLLSTLVCSMCGELACCHAPCWPAHPALTTLQFLRVHFDMSFAWNGVHGILLLSSRAHACTMNNTCPSAHATDITTPSGSHNTCAGHHSHKSQVDEKNSKNCAQKHNAAQVCAVRWAHCRRAGRHAAPACHCREHKCPCSMHIVGAPTSAVSAPWTAMQLSGCAHGCSRAARRTRA